MPDRPDGDVAIRRLLEALETRMANSERHLEAIATSFTKISMAFPEDEAISTEITSFNVYATEARIARNRGGQGATLKVTVANDSTQATECRLLVVFEDIPGAEAKEGHVPGFAVIRVPRRSTQEVPFEISQTLLDRIHETGTTAVRLTADVEIGSEPPVSRLMNVAVPPDET